MSRQEIAIFAAGCFWGVEEVYRKLHGVIETRVGYMGGSLPNPTYEQVCTNRTGHAEVVMVVFDPGVITYKQLLDVFWRIHDPTTLNRQGPDVGMQYRSAIFFFDENQKADATESLKSAQGRFRTKIVTDIAPAGEFYRAEEYHQKYFMRKGGGSCL